MNADGIAFLSPEDFPRMPLFIEGISTRFIRDNRIIPLDFTKCLTGEGANRVEGTGSSLKLYCSTTSTGNPVLRGTITFTPDEYTCPYGEQYDCSGTPPQCTRTASCNPSQTTLTYQNLTYTYDPKGNVATIADTVNSITHTYTYDALDRLLTATGTGTNAYTRTFTYDVLGNITNKSDVGDYQYMINGSTRPHAVMQAGNITLQYDDNGNMIQRAVQDGVTLGIDWNYDNKPTLIKRNTIDYLRYDYDGNGNRVKKQNLQTGSTTRYYGELYEERETTQVIHIFANNQRIASFRTDGTEQYYHSNHLGSASIITDANAVLKQKVEYLPFGTYRYGTSPNEQLATYDYDAAFPDVNYTFTDQEYDAEADIGLYNFKARLYDPLLGRFISADSIVPDPGDLQSLNRYSYCANNPLVYVDPSGNFAWGIAWAAAALAAIITGAQTDWNPGAMITSAAVAFASAGIGSWAGQTTLDMMSVTWAGAKAWQQVAAVLAAGMAGGAFGGGASAAIYGGNIGQGMFEGAGYGAASALVTYGAIKFFRSGVSLGQTSQVATRTMEGSVGEMYSKALQVSYGDKAWIYISESGGGGLGLLAGEGGIYFFIDPVTGTYYQFGYASVGVGIGFGGAAQLEGGIFVGPSNPMDISNWTLSVSGFAASGEGVSGQYTGTSFWGNGNGGSGATAGFAGGAGAGVSGMGTYSWFIRSGTVLPARYQPIYDAILQRIGR